MSDREAENVLSTNFRLLNKENYFDIVVIGGGSAGLAAAVAAAQSASVRVLLIEREEYLGGVLPQCVHDGFGLYIYGESLTGPEYACRWVMRARENKIDIACATTVLSVEGPDDKGFFSLDVMGVSVGGRITISACSVICATGCRERTRGAMLIPGGRPAGVLTAGSAQYMVNVANQMPGDKVVVLGSGDIGLIMARRMILEGADVRMVLGQEATGLVRNHIRCIQDFDIPIRYGWGLVSISGYGQLQGVSVAPLLSDGSFDFTRKQYIRCNVLLIACGLIPEREVLDGISAPFETPGLFICGNAHVPHDLVDQVTQEGIQAGCAAVEYVYAHKHIDSNCAHASLIPQDLKHMLKQRISEPKGKMVDISHQLSQGTQRIVCTVCPSGCVMEVSSTGKVSGNVCVRGEEYALREAKNPTRLFTGTVSIRGARESLVPVRTEKPVSKNDLRNVADAVRHLCVSAPVRMGDVLCENIAHTQIALIATANRERQTDAPF